MNVCGETDTIEHYFYECDIVQKLWNSLYIHYIAGGIDMDLNYLGGINNPEKDMVINTLNFCVLYEKYYIYIYKLNSTFSNFMDKASV